MRAYVEGARDFLHHFKHPQMEINSLGYLTAEQLAEGYNLIQRNMNMLNEQEAPDPELYVPLTAGLVIRSNKNIALRTPIVGEPSVLLTELIDFKGKIFPQTLMTLFDSLITAGKEQIHIFPQALEKVLRNRIYFMGVFLRYEKFKLVEIRLIYTLLVEHDTLFLLSNDKTLRVESIPSVNSKSLNSFSQALMGYIPVINP